MKSFVNRKESKALRKPMVPLGPLANTSSTRKLGFRKEVIESPKERVKTKEERTAIVVRASASSGETLGIASMELNVGSHMPAQRVLLTGVNNKEP